jgi:hypothetical protein
VGRESDLSVHVAQGDEVFDSSGDVGAPPAQFVVQRKAEEFDASCVDKLNHSPKKGCHWMNAKVRGNQPNPESALRPFL